MLKYLFGLMIAGLSISALASDNPVVKKIECSSVGCDLWCMNTPNQWMKIEKGANSIIVSQYDNGNTEFLLTKGSLGDKVVLVGPNQLQCKIEGLK